MGLCNFPSAANGLLPILVMNTIMSIKILKNLLGAFLELMGISTWVYTTFDENPISNEKRVRRISNMKFKCSKFALDDNETRNSSEIIECCVCLSKFKEDEEVSELNCKHFFHKKCLEKWFDNYRSTCPLCRSIY
ncbi:hypothetical protein RND81_11G012800 [Saponaria officinalis]|uniref:RING-type domain-containing protein n=1 Tax=Saponaria officinalis TaxID=3572 RepID=A0AAW1HG36_SAPOF